MSEIESTDRPANRSLLVAGVLGIVIGAIVWLLANNALSTAQNTNEFTESMGGYGTASTATPTLLVVVGIALVVIGVILVLAHFIIAAVRR